MNLVALRDKLSRLALIRLSSQFTLVFFLLKAKLVALKSSAKVVFPATRQKLDTFVHWDVSDRCILAVVLSHVILLVPMSFY